MKDSELRRLVESFEQYLGDPACAASLLSWDAVLEHDEHEDYPYVLLDPLYQWKLQDQFVPAEFGGKAVNPHESFLLFRSVTRRDLTTATCFVIAGIGFLPIWVGGTSEQKAYFAERLRRGAKISWGLSEREHGSDILVNQLTAEKVPGGYRLSGEKWPIGNVTVGDTVTVFARTGKRNSPADFSLFAVEKDKLARETYSHLARERCHGLRALDLSGIRFQGAFVEEGCRIGGEGQGLEIALKASQFARVQICSLALGCADTSLRLAYSFAREREIFGQRVAKIPYSTAQLVDSLCDLLIADALAITAVRTLHGSPAQASVVSSVTKYFVPALLERTMDALRIVLGVRFYLRGPSPFGMFQKMYRDLPVVGLSDGNSLANLKNLTHQIEPILQRLQAGASADAESSLARIRHLFDRDTELAPYRPQEHGLHSRVDDVVQALPAALAVLRERAGEPDVARLLPRAERLLGFGHWLRKRNLEFKEQLGARHTQAPEMVELAQWFCGFYAGATCLYQWACGTPAVTLRLRDVDWLICSLDRLWNLLHPLERSHEPRAREAMAPLLEQLFVEQRRFSFFDIRDAESPPTKESV